MAGPANGLELWRSLHADFGDEAPEINQAKLTKYIQAPKCRTLEQLSNRLNEWIMLGEECGQSLDDEVRAVALNNLVTEDLENRMRDQDITKYASKLTFIRKHLLQHRSQIATNGILTAGDMNMVGKGNPVEARAPAWEIK